MSAPHGSAGSGTGSEAVSPPPHYCLPAPPSDNAWHGRHSVSSDPSNE